MRSSFRPKFSSEIILRGYALVIGGALGGTLSTSQGGALGGAHVDRRADTMLSSTEIRVLSDDSPAGTVNPDPPRNLASPPRLSVLPSSRGVVCSVLRRGRS